MVWLTLLGAGASFWGFFGWFSEHPHTRWRWCALTCSILSLLYGRKVWLVDQTTIWLDGLTLLLGTVALLLCYKR